MRIKLNENENSGMLYAIAYCEDPDIYSEEFWGWDTESDVGYELMEFGSLIQDADVFDSLEAAEDRADDVLSSIFEDEVFIVGLDPYTPHNLTGFVKKITRESINESKFMDKAIKVGDKVKVSTPGNDYYDGRTGVVDYAEDDIVTVKFDDNNSPRLNNFDLNQVTRIDESKSIKESNINTKALIVCPSCKSSDNIILTGPTAFADYDKYLYQPCTCDKCGCKFEANFKEVTDYNVISQGTLDLDESTININENTGYNPEYSSYIEEVAQRIDAGEYDDTYEVCEYVAKKFNKDINTVRDDINKLISDSKFIKESTVTDSEYVEVAYICDGFTNFRVFGGGFKTSDALVSVEDEKGKRLRLTMGDVCEFYTWHDAKGNVIHEPGYIDDTNLNENYVPEYGDEFPNMNAAMYVARSLVYHFVSNPDDAEKLYAKAESDGWESSELVALCDLIGDALEASNYHSEAKDYFYDKFPYWWAFDVSAEDEAKMDELIESCDDDNQRMQLLIIAVNSLVLELD